MCKTEFTSGRNTLVQLCFAELTGGDVCMDIYMMFYILHCTETTFVY